MRALLPYRRHAAIAGAAAGLLASPTVAAPPGWLPVLIASGMALAIACRRAPASPELWSPAGAALLTAALLGLGVLAGLGLGGLRIAAIDAGAFQGPRGERVVAEGFVASVPRSGDGELRFPLDTADGRVVVAASRWPEEELGIGDRVEAAGTLAPPEEFRADELDRIGAALELRGATVESIPGGRGGLTGALDRIRERAELALSEGMSEGRSALARGFVLGQDDLIDPRVRDDFKRSGLAHLLSCYVEAKTNNPSDCHHNSRRSWSAVIPASRRMPASVPRLISLWSGTTSAVRRPSFLRRTWLPRCRTTVQPSRSRARISALPETTGCLGLTPGQGPCGE